MTFIFSSGRSPLSALIRWLTQSRVSHCSIGTTIAGTDVVIEATLFGVEMRTRSRWEPDHTIVQEFEVPPYLAEGALPIYMQALGEGYDYSGLLGYLPIVVARWVKRKIRNVWASPSKVVCSELVVRGLQSQPQFAKLDPETISPEDLLETCFMFGTLFRVVK